MHESKICQVDGCDMPLKARGLCNKHYQRWWKTGDQSGVRPGRWDGYERPACSVDGCQRPSHANLLCSIHAPRARRHGSPLLGRRSNAVDVSLEDFVNQNTDKTPGGCWQWLGAKFGSYGSAQVVGTKQQYVHRIVYTLRHGDPGEGYVIHHTCLNKMCVNPDHLVAMTPGDHLREHARIRRSHPPTPTTSASSSWE